MRFKPELLCPAGDFERLKTAIRYGADAVYLGADRFGMRSASPNFSLDELARATEYAHARGVSVHLTVNTRRAAEKSTSCPAFYRAPLTVGLTR